MSSAEIGYALGEILVTITALIIGFELGSKHYKKIKLRREQKKNENQKVERR